MEAQTDSSYDGSSDLFVHSFVSLTHLTTFIYWNKNVQHFFSYFLLTLPSIFCAIFHDLKPAITCLSNLKISSFPVSNLGNPFFNIRCDCIEQEKSVRPLFTFFSHPFFKLTGLVLVERQGGDAN